MKGFSKIIISLLSVAVAGAGVTAGVVLLGRGNDKNTNTSQSSEESIVVSQPSEDSSIEEDNSVVVDSSSEDISSSKVDSSEDRSSVEDSSSSEDISSEDSLGDGHFGHGVSESYIEIDGEKLRIWKCEDCEEVYIYDEDGIIHPHTYVDKGLIAATCTEKGKSAWFECVDCGKEVIVETEALGHAPGAVYYDAGENHYNICTRNDCLEKVYSSHLYNNWTLLKAPTCTEEGEVSGACYQCGHVGTFELVSQHIWDDGNIIKEPTCIADGEILYTCTVCGETKTEYPKAYGHDWSDWVETVAPTCYTEGEGTRTCLRCGETETATIPPCHAWGEWRIIKEATCTEAGERERTCLRCGIIEKGTIAPGHNWNDGTIIEATCTEHGVEIYQCIRCGEIKAKFLPALGHDYGYDYDEKVHWIACQRTGCAYAEEKELHEIKTICKTEEIDDGTQIMYKHGLYDVCETCGYEKQLGESVLHIHYGVKVIEGKLPTCTEDGYTAALFCAVEGCEELLVASEPLPMTGHLWEYGNCLRCGETQLEMTLTEDGYEVSGVGSFEGGRLKIPVIYKGVYVTSIGYSAFFYCSSLMEVVIPDSVTSIGYRAFYGCDNLTEIVIPDGVTSIGDEAFCSCDNLTEIVIPDSVTSIGGWAFSICRKMRNITIEENNTAYKSIDGDLYSKDGKTLMQYAIGKTATSFTIPDGVTSIDGRAFAYCSNLTSVVIPDGVTSIGFEAFNGCSSLTKIVIPDSVTSIGNSALDYCNSLTEISVDEDNTAYKSIDGNLYSKDGKMLMQYAIGKTATVFIVPDAVTSIHSNAFSWCESLTSVTFGENSQLTQIDRYAFFNCDSLTEIAIPDSVMSIGGSAFSSCERLVCVTFGENSRLTKIDGSAFSSCNNLTEIVIPDGVTNIGDWAFSSCYRLTEIVIPDSVTNIGDDAFYGCDSLVFYCEVESKPENWSLSWNSSGCPVNWDCNNNNVADNGYIYTTVDDLRYGIKDGVATVLRQATDIEKANILSEIIYQETVYKVTSIGEKAFYNCKSLIEVVIPETVTSIGDYAFQYCDALTIYCEIESKHSDWASNWNVSDCPVVLDCDNNDTADDGYIYTVVDGVRYALKDGVATVTRQPKNITKANIAEVVTYKKVNYTVTSIGDDAFRYCRSLTEIVIPDGVTNIGRYAFFDCNNLTKIVIPDGVTSIGYEAFCGCDNLTKIVIPDSVTSIDASAFQYCSSLTSVTFGENSQLMRIGYEAFYWCRSLTEIVIPDSVTWIGERAFVECDSLTKIVIPDSVTWIDERVFFACWHLTIYCETESQPSDWYEDWNTLDYNGKACPVVWGYTGE